MGKIRSKPLSLLHLHTVSCPGFELASEDANAGRQSPVSMYASSGMTECKAEVTPSTSNGHRVFSYTLESHTAAAFAIMNELRLERQLCDVTLRVKYNDLEAVDFVAHKVVLASSSPVFRAMFTTGLKECGKEVVPIEGIHPRVRELPCNWAGWLTLQPVRNFRVSRHDRKFYPLKFLYRKKLQNFASVSHF